MGYGYGAICNACGAQFQVNEGSGMIAMPLHCDRCGRQRWWEFGPGGPMGEAPKRSCKGGGTFTQDAPARCLECRSTEIRRDPEGFEILYD